MLIIRGVDSGESTYISVYTGFIKIHTTKKAH
jgi:hypothetical protein